MCFYDGFGICLNESIVRCISSTLFSNDIILSSFERIISMYLVLSVSVIGPEDIISPLPVRSQSVFRCGNWRAIDEHAFCDRDTRMFDTYPCVNPQALSNADCVIRSYRIKSLMRCLVVMARFETFQNFFR